MGLHFPEDKALSQEYTEGNCSVCGKPELLFKGVCPEHGGTERHTLSINIKALTDEQLKTLQALVILEKERREKLG